MRLRVYPIRYYFPFLLIISLVWVGCDTLPGTESAGNSAPEVSPGSVFVNPEVVDTDRLAFTDGKASTEITVQVNLFDADGDVRNVFVVVQSPVVGAAPAGEFKQQVNGGGLRTFTVPISISEGASGAYQVVVFASDRTERMSNRIFGMLTVTAGSEPPVIDSVDIPDAVTRPAEGQPSIVLPIVAHVSDPDGLDNVLFVEVVVNATTTLNMCDDGGLGVCNAGFGSSGDEQAGDGKFTHTIQLASTNAAGQYLFEFTAVDRSGLRSAQVARILTVN